MMLLWCAPLMAEVAWLDWVRLDWRMRYALLDADGDEREVILSLTKAAALVMLSCLECRPCCVACSCSCGRLRSCTAPALGWVIIIGLALALLICWSCFGACL
jgi:hypothetical protein